MDATSDSMALTIAVASGFLLFAGGFWAVVALGSWALAPVEHRITKFRVPTQFSMREVAILAIELQMAVAVLFWCKSESTAALWTMGVVCCALLAAWWYGAQRLSRCRVTCPWRRGLFLGIVMPLAIASIGAALWINGQAVLDTCLGRHWPLTPWLIGNLGIIGAFVTCRLLTMWAMLNVTPQSTRHVREDGIQYVS